MGEVAASDAIIKYFNTLEGEVALALNLANRARERGSDPTPFVEIPLAKDLADRVEQLIGVKGVAERLRELEKNMSREEASLYLAVEVASGKVGDFASREGAMDAAVRVAMAVLTEGVVAAPLEGIARVKIEKNDDKSEFVRIFYAGPIRSAGGTAQALSVLVADYVRRSLGIGRYKPRDEEVERCVEEIPIYRNAVNLQYTPDADEIRRIVKNCPICIDGEPTEEVEVSGYRDLERVLSNRVRGGMALVIAEGIALKAPKLKKHVVNLKLDGWDWIDTFLGRSGGDEDYVVKPLDKYLHDLIAGRPVFGHPSRAGGFRLRYGRSRNTGFAAAGISPATMVLMDDFIAAGTQLKIERPGKAAGIAPVDSLEGPTVRLFNGDVLRIDDALEALRMRGDVEKILDVGEILINFGDFIENNHPLVPASYCYEWWEQEPGCAKHLSEQFPLALHTGGEQEPGCAKSMSEHFLHAKHTGREQEPGCAKSMSEHSPLALHTESQNHDYKDPDDHTAVNLCETYHVPLHPKFTYLWHDTTIKDVTYLSEYVEAKGEYDQTLRLPFDQTAKDILETLLVHHTIDEKTITIDQPLALIRCLGLDENLKRCGIQNKNISDPVELVSKLSGFTVRKRAPTRIGARMGRPEKSDKRKMKPAPHVLFPVGVAGGRTRSLQDAKNYSKSMQDNIGTITVQMGKRVCPGCSTRTFKNRCERCGKFTKPVLSCPACHIEVDSDTCPKCGKQTSSSAEMRIEFKKEYHKALENLKERDNFDKFKGVTGLISKNKTPEPLEKGVLRAKNDVVTFKDGTIRYDLSDLPLTHFIPREIGTSIEKIRELGYTRDIYNQPLTTADQIIELKVQDIVLSTDAGNYLTQAAQFIDDLLLKYYKTEAYYHAKDRSDLIGKLLIGLAPHTSAGVLARLIGYTTASVGYAHPFFHAAKRRNCLAPGTEILVTNCAGRLKNMDLESLYRGENAREEVVDDFGTTRKTVEGIKTYALNPKGGKFELKDVKSVIKTPAPSYLVSVRTQSGRAFISSPEHRTVVWSNGKIHHKKVLELDDDDKLLVPKKLDLKEEDRAEIDLLEAFLSSDTVSGDVMVRGVRKVVEKIVKELGGLKSTAEQIEISEKTFANYVYRDRIPLLILHSLLGLSHRDWTAIPRECQLSVKRDHTVIPRIIKLDSRFMRLIGYYLAEGYARSIEKEFYQVSMASWEKELLDDMANCIRDVFGFLPGRKEGVLVISNRLIYHLFVDVLGTGKGAKEKRIPLLLRNLPRWKIKELLSAYFSGDGSVERDKPVVSCSSASEKLLQDIGLQLLRFGIFYRLKSERKAAGGAAKQFYERKGRSEDKLPVFDIHDLFIRSRYARKFGEAIGFIEKQKNVALRAAFAKERAPRISSFGDAVLDEIKKIEPVKPGFEFLYDIEVEEHHNFLVNDFVLSANCDGDEDCVMLLMDGLLNFSKSYLPDKRGGKMDAPLVLTTHIDPNEIDKEAHNIDVTAQYPLEFYHATLTYTNPKEIIPYIDSVHNRLGTPQQYEETMFTHHTDNIAAGPKNSAYKTLESMVDKMNAQLLLATKIRAVDDWDVAERVINSHFLPDLIGNLHAFTKQRVRCVKCGAKYRRPPLQNSCPRCGGRIVLTVHEGSVKKYLDVSLRVAEQYNVKPYTKQRIELLKKEIKSLFENDKSKQKGLADFM